MSHAAEIEAVNAYFASTAKGLDGHQPEWAYQLGYKDHQISWPILETDTGRTRSHLRLRVPAADFAYPSISLIFGAHRVAGLDKAPDSVCKSNHPTAAKHGLPAMVCGNHLHDWATNCDVVERSGQWQLQMREPVEDDLPDLTVMLRWFCERYRITIIDHRGPVVMPEPRLLG